ncbi:MAG TPA: class I SAM-dependent methyltransferase [Rubrobacteraceae bacterium]|nr:class I SAM-dependent methyltransferase [Rubrobacteraceae bacterium]
MRGQRRSLIAGGATLLGGGAVALAYAIWWRKNPSACPYEQHFWLEVPHPFLTRARLRRILAPQPGERVLEVGPGTGYYTLDVAKQIAPDGVLDILDLQQQMLDHTMRKASERHITNIVPTQGDAQELPYPDDTFDAAYMTVTLGEVPDQDAALRELCRVLKPDSRLVVGEIFGDPHMVTFGSLRASAEATGLRFEQRLGGKLAYFARFRLDGEWQ